MERNRNMQNMNKIIISEAHTEDKLSDNNKIIQNLAILLQDEQSIFHDEVEYKINGIEDTSDSNFKTYFKFEFFCIKRIVFVNLKK